jgi:hypothetical protein
MFSRWIVTNITSASVTTFLAFLAGIISWSVFCTYHMRSREERWSCQNKTIVVQKLGPQRIEEWTEDCYWNRVIIFIVLILSSHDFTFSVSLSAPAENNSTVCVLKWILWTKSQLVKRRFQRLMHATPLPLPVPPSCYQMTLLAGLPESSGE